LLKYFVTLFCFAFLSGCENTDVMTATDAGIDALKALTLSDKDLQEIASQSAQYSDNKQTLHWKDRGALAGVYRLLKNSQESDSH